jgi:hypothetical protein
MKRGRRGVVSINCEWFQLEKLTTAEADENKDLGRWVEELLACRSFQSYGYTNLVCNHAMCYLEFNNQKVVVEMFCRI